LYRSLISRWVAVKPALVLFALFLCFFSSGSALAQSSLPAPTLFNPTSTSTSITVTWAGVTGAFGYNIYRSSDSESYSLVSSDQASTSYVDTAVTSGVLYYYEAASVDASGVQQSSQSYAVDGMNLGPPSSVSVQPNNGYNTISWNEIPFANHYDVFRGTTSGGETSAIISWVGQSSTPTATDYSLTDGITYFYIVEAASVGSVSNPSPEVSGVPFGNPNILSIAATANGQITLEWTAGLGDIAYNVYRGVAAGAESPTPVASNVAATTYVDSGLSNGVTYFYVVKAVESSYLSTGTYEGSATAIGNPSGLTAVPAPIGVNLSWNAAIGATSYNVLRGTTSGGEGTTSVAYPIPTGTTYNDQNVTAGVTYYYTITAAIASYQSVPTNEASCTPVAQPGPPGNFVATPGNAVVNLSWTAPSGAVNYTIKRATTGTPVLYQTVTGTSFSDTAVTNGTAYTYQVNSVNSVGGISYNSVGATVTPLANPTGFTANAGSSQISLGWTAASGSTSYNLYRSSTSGGEGSTAYQTNLTGTSYTDTGLTDGQTYFYTLAGVNASGTGGQSNEASATPEGPPNTVADGSFETPAVGGFSYDPTGSPWTFTAYTGIQANGSAFTDGNVSAPDGVQTALLQGYNGTNGTISQPIVFTAGTYSLSFDAASRSPWYGGVQSFNVYFDSTLLGSFTPTSGSFVSYTTSSFAATAGTHTIEFAGTNPLGDDTAFIDLVSLSAVVPPPSTPTGLSAAPGNAQVSLSWAASSGAATYNLYRSTSSGGEGTTAYQTGLTGTSYTDTGLTNGVTYFYTLAAVNTGGSSGQSSEVSATPTDAAPPTVATAASATPNPVTGTTTALSVLGADALGESNLAYAWSTTGTPPAAVTYSDNGTNSAKNTTATFTAAGTYDFLVTITDTNGLSVTSSIAVTVGQTSTAIVVSPVTANISWGASQQFSGIVEDQFGNPLASQPTISWSNLDFWFGSIDSTGLYTNNFVDFTDTDTVIAVSGGVYGYATINVTGTPPSQAPDLEGEAIVSFGNPPYVSLTWDSATGASSYNLYRGTSPGGEGGTPIATGLAAGDGAYYLDGNVSYATTYYYTICGVNDAGNGPSSSEVAVTVPIEPVPLPTTLTAWRGSTQVTLDWNAEGGVTGYNLKRSATCGGPYTTIASNVSGTSYSDPTTSNYYYVVTALDSSGESPNSNEAFPGSPFVLSAIPATVTVGNPGSGFAKIIVSSSSGYSGAIAFSVSGIPNDVSGSLYPLSSLLSPPNIFGSATSDGTILQFCAATAALPGTYVVTVTGTSGDFSANAQVTLTVN